MGASIVLNLNAFNINVFKSSVNPHVSDSIAGAHDASVVLLEPFQPVVIGEHTMHQGFKLNNNLLPGLGLVRISRI